MFYCLIASHDDTGDGCHRLLFGSLDQIARKLRRHCYESLREAIEEEELDLDEIEDEYDCDLDDYLDLCDNPDEDLIRRFEFDFSGARVTTIALTATYADLVDAFNAYAPDTYLDPWRMRPGHYVSPDTLRKVDRELINLPAGPARYFAEEA